MSENSKIDELENLAKLLLDRVQSLRQETDSAKKPGLAKPSPEAYARVAARRRRRGGSAG